MHNFHLTLTEAHAVDLRLALFRAFHHAQHLCNSYKALDPALYGSTVAKYEAEAAQIKNIIELASAAWEDMLDRKEAQGTLEQAAWYDTSAELQ